MDEDRVSQPVDSPSSAAHYTLTEQYPVAVGLYQHEDELNWTKLNHFFYVTAGLLAVMGWMLKEGQPIDHARQIMLALAALGAIMSCAFFVSLWSGTLYLADRKKGAVCIEQELLKYGGTLVVGRGMRKEGHRFLRTAPTVLVLRAVPVFGAVGWCVFLLVQML
jgi:hypothetical protein